MDRPGRPGLIFRFLVEAVHQFLFLPADLLPDFVAPRQHQTVWLRLFAKGNQIRGQFRTPDTPEWRDVGQGSMPAPTNAAAKISLQFYPGSEKAEYWARVSEFQILKHRGSLGATIPPCSLLPKAV